MNDLTWIYVITNPSFPKYVKVGWTRHNPHKRISDIDSTGVPTPFDLNYVACVEDAGKLEKLAHQFLDDYRVRSSREFFEVSAGFAREAIRSVAARYDVGIYFEKTYIEDGCDASSESSESDYDDFDEVYFTYKSSVMKAFFDYDINKGMSILLDLCKWLEYCPAVCDFFTDEEKDKFRDGSNGLFEPDQDSINLDVSDGVVDKFLILLVDEDSVKNIIDWLVLFLSDQFQRVARYYITYGSTSRVRLLAANFLYEVDDNVESEVLSVYELDLKVNAIVREPNYYIRYNRVLNQAFVRMCSMLMKSNRHDYDGYLRLLLDFLESSQSSFAQHYPGLRTVMQCYFDGGDFEGCFPLKPYYKSTIC